MVTEEYTIIGMTCEHCVKAVEAELDKIPDQVYYEVQLDSGRLRVSSESSIPRKIIAAAVDEAGYELSI